MLLFQGETLTPFAFEDRPRPCVHFEGAEGNQDVMELCGSCGDSWVRHDATARRIKEAKE